MIRRLILTYLRGTCCQWYFHNVIIPSLIQDEPQNLMNCRLPLAAWAIFFTATFASGIYFLFVLARLPSDIASGYSFQRLAILGIFSLLVLSQAIMLGLIYRKSGWRTRWLGLTQTGRFWCVGLLLSITIILVSQVLLDWLKIAYKNSGTFTYLAYASRLSPVLNWLTLSGVLLTGLILLVYHKDIVS